MLVEARKKAGLSQAEVAERLGSTQSHISLMESGARGLNLLDFLELSQILGFDPSRVLRRLKHFPRKDNRRG